MHALVGAAGVVVLLGICTATALGSSAAQSRVYTLAAVRALLAGDPPGALGRAVRLHATPARQWCFEWMLPVDGYCRRTAPALVAAEPRDLGAPVVLEWGEAPPLLALLRRTPLLSALAPTPQAIAWATPGIYSVELEASPCTSGETAPCFRAVVLDAAE